MAIVTTLAAYGYLAYLHQRTSFEAFIIAVGVLFFSYYFIVSETRSTLQVLGVGLAFRLVWLLALPELSDDYFRFIWDGTLWWEGINAYQYTPQEATALFPNLEDMQPIFEQLNSPVYYSVYPPVSQLVYIAAAWFDMPLYSVVFLRICLILADVLAYVFLRKLAVVLNQPTTLAQLYFLHPLLIVECTGNLHFEGMMIAFLVIAFYFFQLQRWWGSGLSLAIAVGVKLLPLLFVPYLLFRLKGAKMLYFGTILVVSLAIVFLPWVNVELVFNQLTSVRLYFQSFEFNASVYYLLRAAGYALYGYNLIQYTGIALAFVTGGIILFLSYKARTWSSPVLVACAIPVVYLLLSTTVHPWYVLMPLVWSLFTPYRFVQLWSMLVFVSYSAYQTANYQESLGWIALEYAVVIGYAVYEYRRYRLGTA